MQTCLVWPLDGAKAFDQTAWQGWCRIGGDLGKVFSWKFSWRIRKILFKIKYSSSSLKKTNTQKDPDTIACPICHKDWHKSNLRNHLFYGHHMKTAEVEAALLKLRNPKSGLKTESIKNDRTPCPLCERSFKVCFQPFLKPYCPLALVQCEETSAGRAWYRARRNCTHDSTTLRATEEENWLVDYRSFRDKSHLSPWDCR